MERRRLLVTTGLLFGPALSGCLRGPAPAAGSRDDETDRTGPPENGPGGNGPSEGGTEEAEETEETEETDANGEREYETCHLVSIAYDRLPEDVRAEVDAALEEGRYESTDLRFPVAVDPDRSYVVVDGTPYDPVVETDGDARTLELREDDVVRAPEPRTVTVENADDREHEVRVEMTNDDRIVDETLALGPGESVELDATEAFGTYDLSARVLTGHGAEDEFEFAVRDSAFDGIVQITEDDVFVTQEVADVAPCPWER